MVEKYRQILRLLAQNVNMNSTDLSAFPQNLFHHVKADEVFILMNSPLECIHILLKGTCQIEKYGFDGNSILEMNVLPVQFFGLFEAVNGARTHTTSLRCTSACVFLKIPAQKFLFLMKEDKDILWLCLRYLASFTQKTLTQNEQLLLNNLRQNILFKAYQQCQNSSFPVVLHVKKEVLAQELNVPLRTLYRKLNSLYEEGILSSKNGKITVSKQQYNLICQELSIYNIL